RTEAAATAAVTSRGERVVARSQFVIDCQSEHLADFVCLFFSPPPPPPPVIGRREQKQQQQQQSPLGVKE
ncbi:MAG: hypothetical protein QWI73_05760, partial [Alphaproteobacteria bacterium]|nr:hypothetical protein [Alphaproteobacteria bacterium]